MKKNTIMFLIIITSFNCFDSITNYNEVSLGEEFSMRVGESAVISNYGVEIKFDSVAEDSRCPTDAMCIWAGNAVVILQLKESDRNEQSVKLNTFLNPKDVEFSDLIIELKGLSPYPQSDVIINPNDYVAKLVVKKKEN
ncbi:MAG: hypothetical protein A2315_16405 [Ignavibacteria bacterium RIFOXYB2_FULL_35_12]|nr:MAG: hypothetical protein A2058_11050 [Ignavibacteria bacterium GWA2_36_19]OGU49343.1 MAG: hypothetical protein A2006_11945 [Ignavibacteria bacterium GWC2_35_8]OGU61272.1 MAG: hypothetical protein A2X60_13320 [Ignavibacteria bacterium GWF2_35_20]OGU84108.1 MAG: hypothetical protein A3K31_10925 [Ignavibacteria bacterium RIFOXYA12_FULL_35_25]OGU92244.1 MAG: hypothetical protein A2492_14030 [Ignavibacteria bacterium RIFOXYC12_FULL_35_11]OGU92881.1 MAG: hypothetical protein A2347_00920 [Ignavib